MKANELRKLIREEVKKAVKEELQDMLNEAVKFASTPNKTGVGNSYRPITQKDIKRTWSTGPLNPGTIPLEEMLQQTAKTMSNEDYQNVVSSDSSMVKKPNFASSMANNMGMTESSGPKAGIDISKLDFVKNAKAVFDASVKKDKQRGGMV